MATLTIRDLDDGVKARLRVRAAKNGQSMEAEARAILGSAVKSGKPERNLGTYIHNLFADVGGMELDIPPRTGEAGRVDFGDHPEGEQ